MCIYRRVRCTYITDTEGQKRERGGNMFVGFSVVTNPNGKMGESNRSISFADAFPLTLLPGTMPHTRVYLVVCCAMLRARCYGDDRSRIIWKGPWPIEKNVPSLSFPFWFDFFFLVIDFNWVVKLSMEIFEHFREILGTKISVTVTRHGTNLVSRLSLQIISKLRRKNTQKSAQNKSGKMCDCCEPVLYTCWTR